MKADGSIDKYKARFVLKGYRQRECLDYFDTYSPITRINSISDDNSNCSFAQFRDISNGCKDGFSKWRFR